MGWEHYGRKPPCSSSPSSAAPPPSTARAVPTTAPGGGGAFLAGGAVHGGRVIADWPGLGRNALLDNRDLRPTLDLRSVFKAVLGDHMHIDAGTLATRVFPNSNGARPLQRLMRA